MPKCLFDHPSFSSDINLITGLVNVCCDFNPTYFYDQMKRAFEKNQVDGFSIDMKYIDSVMSESDLHTIDDRYTFINDTIAQLECWPCFNEVSSVHHMSNTASTQTIRAIPRVGRNEPCTCGSGKKYKKCCLLSI